MKKFNRNGFTLVEGLLIVLVIAVLGFGGYFVWSKSHTKKTVTTTSSTTSSNSTSSNNSSDTKTASLDVKEWGLSLKYAPNGITLVYKVGGPNLIYVSSEQLGKAEPNCSVENERIGYILRGKPTDKYLEAESVYGDATTFQDQAKNNYHASTLGDYVYIYVGEQMACTIEVNPNPSAATTALRYQTIQAVDSIFKK